MTTTSTIRWQSFALHKDGNQPDEYEDAYAGNPTSGRFAIADGASESSFANLWAKLLVQGFVASRGQTTLNWLMPLQRKWAESVDRLELDWFGEEKRQQGAFATFLGLVLQKGQGGESRWRAVAVGDCCLFQVRQGKLLVSFPASRPADFNNRPPLLCSRSRGGREGLSRAQRKVGKWQKHDRFFLMSDALAEWFLRRHEQQRTPWDSLLRRLAEPDPTAAMTAYIEQLRQQRALTNDDVTLLVIDL
jgi:serine/threonine protein phosphatase PrpC